MESKKQRSLSQAIERIIETPCKALIVLCGITLVGHSNVLANGLVLNDNSLLFGWNLIRNLNNVYIFFARFVPPDNLINVYAPLRVFILALNLKAWGVNTAGYHLFSMFVHLLSVIFVFLLAHRLTADRVIAFLSGLLFALHPANSASIAYFTASTSAFGMTLAMASFFFYVRALGFSHSLTDQAAMERFASDDMDDEVRPAYLWVQGFGVRPADYLWSFFLALTAMLTSGQAAVIPVLFLWFDWTFHQTKESLRMRVIRALPFFVMAGAYFLIKKAVLGYLFLSGYVANSFYLSVILAFKSCLQYLRFSLWPWPLSIRAVLSEGIFSSGVRDFNETSLLTQSIFEPRVMIVFALIAAIFVFSAVKKRKSPIFLFCSGWFFVGLLPVISLFPQTVLFSLEHLYFCLFGFCLMLAFLFVWGSRQLKSVKGRHWRWLMPFVVLAVLIMYGLGTFLNNQSYQDNGTVMLKAVRVTPQVPSLRHDLAVLMDQTRRHEEALIQFQKAIELDPEEPQYAFAAAVMSARMGQEDEAILLLKRAIEIEPQFAEAYFNLAALYVARKDMKAVSKYLTLAQEAYIKQGRFVEAAELLDAADRFFLSEILAEKNKSDNDQ